jgi:drug/metabolite transporter (DMT)-like permease
MASHKLAFRGCTVWWSVGRGIEALRSSRKAIISPRVTLPETIFSALLVCVGVVVLVGTITSTPDDRRDLQFIALLVGGVLWGSFTIAARILQWKIRRKAKVVLSLA